MLQPSTVDLSQLARRYRARGTCNAHVIGAQRFQEDCDGAGESRVGERVERHSHPVSTPRLVLAHGAILVFRRSCVTPGAPRPDEGRELTLRSDERFLMLASPLRSARDALDGVPVLDDVPASKKIRCIGASRGSNADRRSDADGSISRARGGAGAAFRAGSWCDRAPGNGSRRRAEIVVPAARMIDAPPPCATSPCLRSETLSISA